MTYERLWELDERNVVAYLVERGLLAPSATATVEVLGGGVSNQVLKVVGGERRFVVKQSLPALRVAAVWTADRRRVLNEAAAMRLLADLLPEGSIPAVCDVDATNYVLVMACAPDDAVNWKGELLDGRVDVAVVDQCARLLATIHRRTRDDSAAASLFDNPRIVRQLRIEPYYEATAAVHPDVAPRILAVARRTLDARVALVHGDFSPKNVLVVPRGARRQVVLLDFEVVHYGDPSFDVATMLNHLLLKGLYHLDDAEPFFAAARRFWTVYRATAGSPEPDLERRTVEQVGCLMLARVDGKSPVEYARSLPLQALIRQLAKRLLIEAPPTLDDALSLFQGCFPSRRRQHEVLV